jgi:hypothetical protein
MCLLHQRGVSYTKKKIVYFPLFLIITFTVTTATLQLLFLISSFRRVLNVVLFLLGDSPASEFYGPTYRNTMSGPAS